MISFREGRWKFDIDPLRLSGTVAGFGLAYVVMNRLEGHRTATPAVTITEVSEVCIHAKRG